MQYSDDDPSRTQVIRIGGDDRETKTFLRPGETRLFVKPNTQAKGKEVSKPGPVMKAFGIVFAVMFALFCLGIIGITFAFVLWKYYDHLFH